MYTNIDSLYEVEDSNSVPNWGKEAGSVGAEQEVSLTVNGSQQVGELEVCLHDLLLLFSLWYSHSGVVNVNFKPETVQIGVDKLRISRVISASSLIFFGSYQR